MKYSYTFFLIDNSANFGGGNTISEIRKPNRGFQGQGQRGLYSKMYVRKERQKEEKEEGGRKE